MDDDVSPALPVGSDTASQLVGLIINQDSAAQGWLKFFFSIQSALAAAFLFVASVSQPVSWAPRWFAPALMFIMPFLGIVFTRAFVRIFVRQTQWQSWFIQKLNALPAHAGRIFPVEERPLVPVAEQPDGPATRIVRALGRWIAIAWLIAAALVVYAFFAGDIRRLLAPWI